MTVGSVDDAQDKLIWLELTAVAVRLVGVVGGVVSVCGCCAPAKVTEARTMTKNKKNLFPKNELAKFIIPPQRISLAKAALSERHQSVDGLT